MTVFETITVSGRRGINKITLLEKAKKKKFPSKKAKCASVTICGAEVPR